MGLLYLGPPIYIRLPKKGSSANTLIFTPPRDTMSVSSKPEHTNGDTCLVGQFLGALKKPPQSEILPHEAKLC